MAFLPQVHLPLVLPEQVLVGAADVADHLADLQTHSGSAGPGGTGPGGTGPHLLLGLTDCFLQQ